MGKESFISYLKSISAENSGKPNGYTKGMEVIEELFFLKALTDSVDIWNFITLDNIDALREVVLREQKNDDGIFKDYKPVSYWRDGFCSAALNAYKSYLLKNRSDTHENRFVKMVLTRCTRNLRNFITKARKSDSSPEQGRLSRTFYDELAGWKKPLEQRLADLASLTVSIV